MADSIRCDSGIVCLPSHPLPLFFVRRQMRVCLEHDGIHHFLLLHALVKDRL